jgi:hypothetical protein
MCVLMFYTHFVSNISHSKKNSARYCHKCTLSLHVKYPLFFPNCNEIWNFLDISSYNPQISHFMKIGQVGAENFNVYQEAHTRKLASHNFANTPKNRKRKVRTAGNWQQSLYSIRLRWPALYKLRLRMTKEVYVEAITWNSFW